MQSAAHIVPHMYFLQCVSMVKKVWSPNFNFVMATCVHNKFRQKKGKFQQTKLRKNNFMQIGDPLT